MTIRIGRATSWAPAHGAAATQGRLLASEPCRASELPAATATDTDRPERTPDGRFAVGNRIARAKRFRTGPRGGRSTVGTNADPAWLAAARWGRRLAAHRRAELARAHGGAVSAGVGVLVESVGDLTADARYWRLRAMATGNPDLSRLAALLLAQARACERDAWELASREALTRPAEGTLAALERKLALVCNHSVPRDG
jgi:hypothetical protein